MLNARNWSRAAPEGVHFVSFDGTVMTLPPAALIQARRAVVV
jgi:hypothetical protein